MKINVSGVIHELSYIKCNQDILPSIMYDVPCINGMATMTQREFDKWESFVSKSVRVDKMVKELSIIEYPKYTAYVFDSKPKDQFETKNVQYKWLLNNKSNKTNYDTI